MFFSIKSGVYAVDEHLVLHYLEFSQSEGIDQISVMIDQLIIDLVES